MKGTKKLKPSVYRIKEKEERRNQGWKCVYMCMHTLKYS